MANRSDIEAYLLHTLKKIQNLLYMPESVQILNQVKNKDVVIFLGNTRCGKSTLVNYAIGNSLSANKVRRKTYNIVKQNPSSKGPTIGISSTSVTTIPTAWISSQINGLIVDAPGFDDNRGEVQDIANSFYIKEVISNARSIKLVFISDINDIRSDSVAQFIKFLDVVHRMIPNVGNLNKGMVLLFTKDNDSLTTSDIRQLLKEKIIDEREIKIGNRNFVEYFYYNFNQIVNVRMPQMEGTIDENYIFQNLIQNINATQSFANNELLPIVSSISEKSRIFLLEAHRFLSEVQEFDDVLQKVYHAFVKDLNQYSSGDKENVAVQKGELMNLKQHIVKIKESTGNKLEKLEEIRKLAPEIDELKETSDLYVKLKFVSFVDDILKIQESNIFTVKMDRLLSNMASKINETIVQVQNILEEISSAEYNRKLQELSAENTKMVEEFRREINRLEEENREILKEMKKNEIVDVVIQGLAIAAKVFFFM